MGVIWPDLGIFSPIRMVIRLIHSSWLMRSVYDSQYDLYKVSIAEIEFDLRSRDDIPAVLMGLQALHGDAKIRGRIFEILQKRVRPGAVTYTVARAWICGAFLF